METDGYVVLPGWWADVRAVRTTANKYIDADSGPIFNDNPTMGRNDRKRIQATVPKVAVRILTNTLQAKWPNHHVGGAVALRSLPGCQRQAAHCDYIPDATFLESTDDTVPLLFLLALEDGTKLDVWPGSHRLVRNPRASRRVPTILRRTLTLNAGDAVAFRGDLVHAGSSYDTVNTRIHVYLDSPSVPRDPNRTWIVYKHADPLLRERIDEVTE
jgi:ectoine hydroxylase-related dioxygenase (phytanoyl-CoA dioxygenase family)